MADRRYTINAFTVNLEPPPSAVEEGLGVAGTISLSAIQHNAETLLALFEEFDVRATFFVNPQVMASLPALVRAIGSAGHEIAILSPRFSNPLDQLLHFRERVAAARTQLEDICGQRVSGFRFIPVSSRWRSPALLETLVQEGLVYSSSSFPRQSLSPLLLSTLKRAHRVATESGPLWEIPLTSWRPLGIGIPSLPTFGGAYFSLLPGWMIVRGVEGMNRHGEPALLHVHSWGLDPVEPEAGSAPMRERLLTYGPPGETLEKLRRVFRIYRFAPIIEAYASRLTTEDSGNRPPRRTSIIRSGTG